MIKVALRFSHCQDMYQIRKIPEGWLRAGELICIFIKVPQWKGNYFLFTSHVSSIIWFIAKLSCLLCDFIFTLSLQGGVLGSIFMAEEIESLSNYSHLVRVEAGNNGLHHSCHSFIQTNLCQAIDKIGDRQFIKQCYPCPHGDYGPVEVSDNDQKKSLWTA